MFDEIPDTALVETEVGPLSVLSTGRGATDIVLWPSIFTDRAIYGDLATALGSRYRLHLIDGPGHGASPGSKHEVAMKDYARGMAAVMDALGLQSAIVGGTSWGGLVGAELALAEPARVRGLILMNTPLRIDGRRPGLRARFIAAGARWGLSWSVFRDGVARSFFTDLSQRPDYRQAFHSMLRAADPSALAAHVRSVILRGRPLLPRLADIAKPTLVVAGRDDPMYPLADQEEAARRLPLGLIEVVPGRHISPVEAPGEVAAAIDAFVTGIGRPQGTDS